MRRFRKEFGLKKARILRERLIPVSQRLKIGINRHPLYFFYHSHCAVGRTDPSRLRHLGSFLTIFDYYFF